MIEIRLPPGAKMIELGCGANRHPASTCAVDVRFIEGVTDFAVDFNSPDWPIGSGEFDAAYSCFVLEHVSWRNTLQFLKECFRILKPGGKLVLITPNTEEQMRYLLKTSDWDVAGCLLFGDLDYPENSHRAFVNPSKLTEQLNQAGFKDVLITPFGNLQTDMLTQAMKPIKLAEEIFDKLNEGRYEQLKLGITPNVLGSNVQSTPPAPPAPPLPPLPPLPPASVLFDRRYWDGGNEYGGFQQGYFDFPCHEITAQHILARKPEGVLELGCARGYVLKRIEDAGIHVQGIDASRHCYLTRVCQSVIQADFAKDWGYSGALVSFDLCYSIAVLDCLHEDDLPVLVRRMASIAGRGLHGINFSGPGADRTRQTCKPREWWVELFEKHAPNWPVEIVDKDSLENGNLSPTYLAGDGKLKLHIGSATTMYHHGWLNMDILDLSPFANGLHYKFKQHDVREGLPFDTECVDAIVSHHMLEHLTYKEGLAFLKECRRVLKPSGAMRISVPSYDKIALNNDPSENFKELSGTCDAAETPVEKIFELLYAHHFSTYDEETLSRALVKAGFRHRFTEFRKCAEDHPMQKQILRETMEFLEPISLFMEAYVPEV